MDAKTRFKEGWIMLLRPFEFAELKRPLQKLTILYAYSESPIIKMELSKEGKEMIDKILNQSNFLSGVFEDQDSIEARQLKEIKLIEDKYTTIENYEGELVQCYVEGQTCKFYPDEYKIITTETFNEVITAEEYMLDVQHRQYFKRKDVIDKVDYIRSRGIDKNLAERMASAGAKDSVLFRPRIELLQYLCRDYEIYYENVEDAWTISPIFE